MKTLSLKIDERVIHRLMASGQLCVADFKCLDCESKACVWRIALENTGSFTVLANEYREVQKNILKMVSEQHKPCIDVSAVAVEPRSNDTA